MFAVALVAVFANVGSVLLLLRHDEDDVAPRSFRLGRNPSEDSIGGATSSGTPTW